MLNSASTGSTITFNIPTSDPGYDASTGVYTILLATPDDQVFGPSALRVTNKEVTIDGGSSKIVIARNETAQPVRLRHFHMTATGALTLKNLTLANGRAMGGTGIRGGGGIGGEDADGFGGAVFNLNGKIIATNSTLAHNVATTDGGAIYSLGLNGINTQAGPSLPATTNGTPASVTLDNSILSGSTNGITSPQPVADYFQRAAGSGGTLGHVASGGTHNLIQNRPAAANDFSGGATTATPQLGALADNGGPTSTHALLPGSPAIDAGSNNLAPKPGNTDQRGSDRIVQGHAGSASAIVDLGAYEFIPQPEFSAANYNIPSGSGATKLANLTVHHCTFVGNSATNAGGAIHSWGDSPFFLIENSTFNGNSAPTGSAISAGAVSMKNLRHLTVTNNTGNNALSFWKHSTTLTHSIVAGNTADGIGLVNGAALAAASTHNLIGPGPSGGLTHGINGNLTGIVDPLLGSLTNNGGPTQTHTLLPGSPAIDAATPLAGISTDQRGTARPQGAAPGPATLRGSAVHTAHAIRLTDEDLGGTGAVVFDGVPAGPFLSGFTATFNLAMGPHNTNLPADGASFAVGDLGSGAWGETGPATARNITIGFDTFNNNTLESNIGIHLRVNGVHIARNPVNPYTNGAFVPVEIHLDDGAITVGYNGTIIFNQVPVPAFTFQNGDQFGIGARTGGIRQRTTVDNVTVITR